MTQHYLKLHLKAVDHNGWPSIRIMFDGDIYEEVTLNQPEQFIELPLNLPDGNHLLEIERYGKTDDNVLFVDGKVLKDQIVELVDIYVDNIKLGPLFKYNTNAVFKHKDGEIPNSYFWGFNGTFTWEFTMPIVDWLIKIKQTSEEDNLNLYIPHKKDTATLNTILAKLESSINESKI